MRKTLLLLTSNILAVSLVAPAFAQVTSSDVRSLREGIRSAQENVREEIRTEQSLLREGIRSDFSSLIDEFRVRLVTTTPPTQEFVREFRERRAALLDEIAERRGTFREAVREKRDALRAELNAARDALRERLQSFRDERRSQTVERIANRLNDANGRMVERFLANLEQIENVLVRISSRADKAAANGVDITTVVQAIVEADHAILAARDAVAAQADAVYAVIPTSEEHARSDVGTAVQALETDLRAVRRLVQAARDAVHNAAVLLGQIPSVDDYEVETTSAPPTP